MSDESPSTFGELRHEAPELEATFDQKLDNLFADIVTRKDFEIWALALEARLSAAFERSVRTVLAQHVADRDRHT